MGEQSGVAAPELSEVDRAFMNITTAAEDVFNRSDLEEAARQMSAMSGLQLSDPVDECSTETLRKAMRQHAQRLYRDDPGTLIAYEKVIDTIARARFDDASHSGTGSQ